MERDEEERFREWLDLDQADQDTGLLLPSHHYEGFTNEPTLFTNYPSSLDATTIQPFTQLHLAPTTTTNPELSLHRALATPTYALDPALISASIPPPPSATSVGIINNNAPIETTHHTDLAKFYLPRRSVSSHLPFKREDGSMEQHDDEEDDHDDDGGQDSAEGRFEMNRNNHSRSSSAILFPASSASRTHKRTLSHSHPLINVPDWQDKPSAEEYKMLSSKEKRQLRNKISARNFRHRRKQHISTLEQQLAQRDEAIENLNKDLGQARLENKELKSQVEVLKQKWSDLMKKIEEMSLNSPINPSTVPSPPTTTTSTGCSSSSTFLNPASPRSRSAKTNGMIPLPNLHKDLGSHTRKPFNGVGGMTGGGNVGVHTTLIPEVTVDVYEGPFLIGSNDSIRSPAICPDEDLSPQALIELKIAQEKNQANMGARNVATKKEFEATMGPIFDERHHKAGSTPRMEGDSYGLQENNKTDLIERLMSMVFETLRRDSIDPLDLDASNSNEIDLDKLKACLEGRLVFKLVELSPPPYRLVHPSTSTTSTTTTNSKNTEVTTTITPSIEPIPLVHSSDVNIPGLSSRFSQFHM